MLSSLKLPKLSKLNQFIWKNKPPSNASSTPQSPPRPMKYPYTFSAKIAQFPYRYYFEKNMIFRYYVFGVIASIPFFIYISGLSNSPANKEKWTEIRKREHEELSHKFD